MEIKLTEKEQERYAIIRPCINGAMTNKEAAHRLGLTIRQVQKIKRAVRRDGTVGIRHGACGKASSNATKSQVAVKVKNFLAQKQHRDFGPTFAKEQLEKNGIILSTETIRSLMIRNHFWQVHARRRPQIHREWRERMESYGMLVQFDGSYHDWFETGTEACLLAAIDDATGKIIKAVFEDNEGVLAVFRFWKAYIEAYGRPVAIYLDKFSTYKVNHKNAVDNAEMMTQFQRTMEELSITVICANSPEAKGRVERLFGTLQDRLVKEMRLAHMQTRALANDFLHTAYIPDHNQRFSVAPRKDIDAHRPLTEVMREKLSSIFSVQSQRKVHNDYTVQFKTRWFQLNAIQQTTVYKGDAVILEERLDGTLHIRLKHTYLHYTELPDRPKPILMKVTVLTRKKPTWIPPKNHPWRNDFLKN